MADLYRSALTLSLTSLGVTFLALAMFALLIVVLREVFSTHPVGAVGVDRQSSSGSDEELAAAIGLAIHLSGRPGPAEPALGAALLRGPGPYWRPPILTGQGRLPPIGKRND